MCNEMSPWEKVVEFHGHTCPGLAMGYRAAQEALKRLDHERSEDEELVAIVETDACGADAVQVLTGCTFGKGNFIYRDLGKQAFTFGSRSREKGIRCVLKYDALNNLAPPEWAELRKKVFTEEVLPEEKRRFQELHHQLTDKLLQEPLENIMEVQTVPLDIPPKARIFETIQCAFCGEGVMEPRAKVKQGKFACPDCI